LGRGVKALCDIIWGVEDVLVVRRANQNDISAIAHLWFLLSLDHQSYHRYYAVRNDGEMALVSHVRELMFRNCIILVAEKEKQLCGFVSGYIVARNPQLSVDRVGKVDNIFVKESLRGQGVGSSLLTNLFNFFKENKIEYYEISCDIQNPEALKLYKRFGFVEQKIMLVNSNLSS